MDSRRLLKSQLIEEVLTPEAFQRLLVGGMHINHYIGFEISGKLHLGSGVITMYVIKQLQELGVNTRIFLADWHSWINMV